ncbi:antitoxin [Aquisalimonas sp. 2447]|nr:antitoxin Xre-like helix-turn-helix domain-containing protein [Aquisalimonas sp. 2447]QIT55891.1 antitoxin [Aquisalimonas sp. 2447]
MSPGSEIHKMVNVLGLEEIPGGYTALRFSQKIASGLPLRSIEHVHRIVAPRSKEFSTLVITKQTLVRRRKKREPLSRTESERLARIARVWSMAKDVYKDEDRARTFLSRAHHSCSKGVSRWRWRPRRNMARTPWWRFWDG